MNCLYLQKNKAIFGSWFRPPNESGRFGADYANVPDRLRKFFPQAARSRALAGLAAQGVSQMRENKDDVRFLHVSFGGLSYYH